MKIATMNMNDHKNLILKKSHREWSPGIHGEKGARPRGLYFHSLQDEARGRPGPTSSHGGEVHGVSGPPQAPPQDGALRPPSRRLLLL